MDNLVKVRLTEEVMLTPSIKKAIGGFGIPEDYEDYSLVGRFLTSRQLASLTAARFQVVAVLHQDKPIAILDEVLTITLSRSARVQTYMATRSSTEILKTDKEFILDGVCFQRNEEIVLRLGKVTTMLASNLEVRVRSAFVNHLRKRCKRKHLINVVYPRESSWGVVGIYAYSIAEVSSILHTDEPYFLTEDSIPVGNHTTESMLSFVKTAVLPDGQPCEAIDTLKSLYRNRCCLEGEVTDPLLAKWVSMSRSPVVDSNVHYLKSVI